MATIKPFRGLRFTKKAGTLNALVCPPYDIINEQQRLGFLTENPHNIIRLELPKEGENRYATAADTLQSWIDNEILALDDMPAVYILEVKFEHEGAELSFKSIISKVKVEDFERKIILPHEQTLSKDKGDRWDLLSACKTNFSQIQSLYMDEKCTTSAKIESLTSRTPNISAEFEGATHNVWMVSNENDVNALCGDFTNRKLYIADGHHRYETALAYSKAHPEREYVMMALIDINSPGLVVLPTHRVIRDLSEFNLEALLEKISADFMAEKMNCKDSARAKLKAMGNSGHKSFTLYADNAYYNLTLKPENYNKLGDGPLSNLDVTALHELILQNAIEISKENFANQTNLTYTRCEDEAIDTVNKGANCAFIINAPTIAQIEDVCENQLKMPQKSTYFYPKLVTGLVMAMLEH